MPTPADAGDAVLDQTLSTSGMSRKILLAMVVLAEAFLLIVAYGATSPSARPSGRASGGVRPAQRRPTPTSSTASPATAQTVAGYLENPSLPGKPLNTPELQSTNADQQKANVKMIYQTVRDGRGAIMPAWGDENGGPLNYEMINEMVTLITSGRWDLVHETIVREGAAVPTEAAIVDPVVTGQLIVTQGACASCHAVTGTAARGTIGPNLSGIASRQIAGVLPFTRDNVKRWITGPSQVKPGTTMPPYSFQERHLDAIAAYLETLK